MTDKSIGGFLIVEKRFHRRCGGGASISFPAICSQNPEPRHLSTTIAKKNGSNFHLHNQRYHRCSSILLDFYPQEYEIQLPAESSWI
jgi:hypothetical protein